MAAIVVSDPTLIEMTVDTGGGPTTIDLCQYVKAVRIDTSSDEVDTSTMCQTSSELGQPSYSITLALLWSWEMAAALEPYVRSPATFMFKPGDQSGDKQISWSGYYAAVPYGDFTLGAVVEADMTLAVTTPPVIVDAP